MKLIWLFSFSSGFYTIAIFSLFKVHISQGKFFLFWLSPRTLRIVIKIDWVNQIHSFQEVKLKTQLILYEVILNIVNPWETLHLDAEDYSFFFFLRVKTSAKGTFSSIGVTLFVKQNIFFRFVTFFGVIIFSSPLPLWPLPQPKRNSWFSSF